MQEKWYKLQRKVSPFVSYNFTKGLLTGDYFKKILKLDFGFTSYRYINQAICFPQKEFDKGVEIVREKVFKKTRFLKMLAEKHFIFCQRLIKSSKLKWDLTTWPNERIIEKLKNYSNEHQKFVIFWVAPLWVERICEGLLKEILRRKSRNNKKIQEYFKILTPPSQLGFPEKAERDLYKIDFLLRKKKILSLNSARVKREVEKNFKIKKICEEFLKKYGWLNIEFGFGEPWNIDDLLERLKEIDNPGQRLKELKDIDRGKKRKIRDVFLKLFFDEKEKQIIDIIRKFVFLRTYRKNIVSKSDYLIRPMFKEIAKRLNVSSYEDVIYLTVDEISADLMDKLELFKELIKQRKRDFATIGEGNRIKIVSGKELKKYKKGWERDSEEGEILKEEIRGNVAYKGLVRGKVKLILDKDKIKLFKKGEILVVPMTTTDFMLAIHKAKAIITDEGGITCHAAIVSREFRIPCIIGTKIATKVLRDGDLVEVDANKGIVRLIK